VDKKHGNREIIQRGREYIGKEMGRGYVIYCVITVLIVWNIADFIDVQ
jgi:hypothetical protein